MGLFVTFEGGEGSGKSTQTRSLYRRLKRADYNAIQVYEPGGSTVGNHIRDMLKGTGMFQRFSDRLQLSDRLQPELRTNMSPLTELFLFEASRAQLVADVIYPHLQKQSSVVLCDRFTDSTLAYQGYGRKISMRTIRTLNKHASRGLRPDLTVLLDLDAREGLNRRARAAKRRKETMARDRFDSEELAFHQRVRNGFLALAKKEPTRWLVVDARLPAREIHELVWLNLEPLLHSKDR